ncbi:MULTISPECIES: hypothetical protein [unclassified Amycolatopsis]|uniref:hypothetical protein n=1 Tax=unclassified Amycolatopsis TaxID=2618356 RepID=UPI001FF3C3DD|nr:hypothetical protein [Amycolatopsis sp. FBCC-B4732]UOX89298.1 hypothetical protein MUY14_01240 [Amycolatopsis sp. FBCC-B4732]
MGVVIVAAIAVIVRRGNALWLLVIAGVLLLALFVIDRGDPAMLVALAELVRSIGGATGP